jgi:hypothetical protein
MKARSRKTLQIRVWLSKGEHAVLIATAKALGLFKTDVIRLATYEKIMRLGQSPDPSCLGPTARRLAKLASGPGQAIACALNGEDRGMGIACRSGKGVAE